MCFCVSMWLCLLKGAGCGHHSEISSPRSEAATLILAQGAGNLPVTKAVVRHAWALADCRPEGHGVGSRRLASVPSLGPGYGCISGLPDAEPGLLGDPGTSGRSPFVGPREQRLGGRGAWRSRGRGWRGEWVPDFGGASGPPGQTVKWGGGR